ncbi:Hypothetical Protein FCC1311_055892 [Hondaea fermentalgiana]|uniref:Uncharacterized protein n=1 Tax=Hondaea fermentalgiana TaxID=2315210 RepID=A0A2R5GEK3_9STRA|nr:Hypothetical Protein FCC1311_055892 [Hondaea fermentalgiana]|eukprot:GBG29367.1 Hypothetical Protein FCC1311_055892 [Hondaea fermentalgiana]
MGSLDADASDAESVISEDPEETKSGGRGGGGAGKEASRVAELEKELAATREQLRATQQTAKDRMREVNRLKGLREDLSAANEANARCKEQVKRLTSDKETLVARVQSAQNAEREAQAEARRKNAEASEARKELTKIREDLEWERKFRAGQEKAKDRLTRTVQVLQTQVKQQTDFTGVAQKQLLEEQKEVHRERAQRLLEVHKLKATQDERDEMRALAEKKLAEAESALRSADYMHKQLEPLRYSLQEFERLAQDDAAQIESQGSLLAEAAANAERLQMSIARKDEEIELLTRRLEKLSKAQSSLRAQVFRLLKTHPELASFVPQVAQSSLSGVMATRALGSEGQIPALGSRTQSLRDDLTERTHESDGDEDEAARNSAIKFALLLDDCLEQLDDKPRTAFERLTMPEIAGSKPLNETSCDAGERSIMDVFREETFDVAALLASATHGTVPTRRIFDTRIEFAVARDALLVEALLVQKGFVAACTQKRLQVMCCLQEEALLPAELRDLRLCVRPNMQSTPDAVNDNDEEEEEESALMARFCECKLRSLLHECGWASLDADDPWKLYQVTAEDLARPMTEVAAAVVRVNFRAQKDEMKFSAHVATTEVVAMAKPEHLRPGAHLILLPTSENVLLSISEIAPADIALKPTATDRWLEKHNADMKSDRVQIPDPRSFADFSWRMRCETGLSVPPSCSATFVCAKATESGLSSSAPFLFCMSSFTTVPRRRASSLVLSLAVVLALPPLHWFQNLKFAWRSLRLIPESYQTQRGKCPSFVHGFVSANFLRQGEKRTCWLAFVGTDGNN